MIKNIVFDIGKVLVTFDPVDYFVSHFHDVQVTTRLCNIIFSSEAWAMYDQGVYYMDDLHAYFQERYPNDYEPLSYILTHWLSLMELKEDSYQYLVQMKEKGYHIYLLSNISEDSAKHLKATMPFFKQCDGEVLSYVVKCNKPKKQIYQALFHQYHLREEECIFLDDRQENIDTAIALGMHGVVFSKLESVKKEVEEIIERCSQC